MATSPNSPIHRARQRIKALHGALNAIDVVCSGTLLERTKTCGKPGCRCATDPAARHGPYFEWTHMVEGKYTHRIVPKQQAQAMRRAIANYHTVQELLKAWEAQSSLLIETQFPRKP
jgi:hypothetical protein